MCTQLVCGYMLVFTSLRNRPHACKHLSVFEYLGVCAGVHVCQTLLSSPAGVIEDDMAGHCRLMGLVVSGERQGNERSSDTVFLTYHHIDIVLSLGMCVYLP